MASVASTFVCWKVTGMSDIGGYASYLQAGGAAPGTVRLRRHYLKRLAEHYPGRPLLDLRLDELVGFLSRSGWQPETRKSARSAIRGFYDWAERTDRITKDPSRLLPTVKVPPGAPRPAPEAVLLRALEQATHREQTMLLLAALAGLRRTEIATLRTDDVVGEYLRIRGKAGRIRLIPTHPALTICLDRCPPGYVFPGRCNGHLSPGHVGVVVKRLLGPGWSCHGLRHRFASRAYAAERDLRAVQTLLGHSKPETTARYTAIPDGALLAAVLAA